MLAGVLDRVLSGRRSQYLHRVDVVERGPRPSTTDAARRPHSYHGGRALLQQHQQQHCRGGRDGEEPAGLHVGARAALKAGGRKLAAKFWLSCGSSRAASAIAAATASHGDTSAPTAAVRKRTDAVTTASTACSNGGFSNVSHTWRFKRLRYMDTGSAAVRRPAKSGHLVHAAVL